MVIVGIDCGDHACSAVTTEAVTQHTGHQAVAVRHKRFLATCSLLQRNNDHLEEVKAAVDEFGLIKSAVGSLLYSYNTTKLGFQSGAGDGRA